MYERTFFITTVCHNRKPVFRLPSLAELFVDTIFTYRTKGKFLLHEFVIMPDHAHFILTPDIKIPMERAIQFIKGGFSYRCNKEANFAGEIWQERPTDHRIRDDADYEHHREYIHMSPVRAGLVANAADYPYSSASKRFKMDALPHQR